MVGFAPVLFWIVVVIDGEWLWMWELLEFESLGWVGGGHGRSPFVLR